MTTKQYYREGRGYRRTNKKRLTTLYVGLVGLACVVLSLSGIVFVQWKAQKSSDDELTELEALVSAQEKELMVLRGINPYQYKYAQILTSEEASRDMLPGWVTRVYTAPDKIGELGSMMDMGAFILDQSTFTLASHQSYGVESPVNPLYRMNGVLPSNNAGRFQIGMRFSFLHEYSGNEAVMSRYVSCFARLDVNNKRVIEKRIKFNVTKKSNELVTGDVMVERGIHPISAVLYCDDDSSVTGSNVQISMTFREPGAQSFRKSGDSVFHLYKRS